MTSNGLHRLLDRNLTLPGEYRDQLTSHLPMALHALQQLGASDERLQGFFDHYAERFAGQSATAPAATPAAADADVLLRQALPELMQGVAGAAFHGLIRTAHAVQAGHAAEQAAALRYWRWRWQPLAEAEAGPPIDFAAWAGALQSQALGWRSDAGLISSRMAEAASSAPYRALAGRLRAADDLLWQLARWASSLYAASGNFTVLHMVTATRALWVLRPWLGDMGQATPLLARAYAAAYLAASVDPGAPPLAAPERNWPEVKAAAIISNDDHVIKLVHACLDLEACIGDPAFLRAARVAVARAS